MRMKNLAALLAASSLMLASSPALSANAPGVASIERASASLEDESSLADGGFIGLMIIFGAGVAVGALLYSLIKSDNEEPVSP